MSDITKGGITIVLCVAAYLLFAGSVDRVELGFALGVSVLTMLLMHKLARVSRHEMAFAVPARAILKPLAGLLPEAAQVGGAFIKSAWRAPLSGAFVEQPFEYGDADPAAAGRRAIVLIGSSLAPRSFIIRGDRQGVVITHSLPPKPPAEDRRWLA